MKTILLATDEKFWRRDRGGFVRIANLYEYLQSIGCKISIYFIGHLSEEDHNLIQERFGEAPIYNLLRQDLQRKKPIGGKQTNEKWPNTTTSKIQSVSLQVRNQVMQKAPDWVLRGLRKVIHPLRSQPFVRSLNKTPEPRLKDYYSEIERAFFREICTQVQPDFVLVEFIRFSYLVEGLQAFLPRHSRTLIDTIDVMSMRCQRFHEAGERHWINITEAEEKQALALFDVIIAIQNQEAEIIRRLLPKKPVITVGHTSELIIHGYPNRTPVALAYIGTNGPHNQHAIRDFLQNVWPILCKNLGHKIKLHIAGSVCSKLGDIKLPERVRLLGYLDNLDDFYRDSDIVINPVQFGGGLKIKNVEALCHGRPLVTTPLGAEGLEHGIGQGFFACDSNDVIVNTLTQLVENYDQRQELSAAALAFAQNNFTKEVAYQNIYSLLMDEKNMRVSTVIPVRLASKRFPEKALAQIEGRPLLWHVWSQVCKATQLDEVYVATDAPEVVTLVQSWGGETLSTSSDCRNGTERIASILPELEGDLVLNVQGDVILRDPGLLDELVASWQVSLHDLITPIYRITHVDDLLNPDLVKVVRAAAGHAIYFSRSPIPYVRDLPPERWLEHGSFWGHIGVYGYRREVLQEYPTLAVSHLESAERLEQLRFLEAGYRIFTLETSRPTISVDSPADLIQLENSTR